MTTNISAASDEEIEKLRNEQAVVVFPSTVICKLILRIDSLRAELKEAREQNDAQAEQLYKYADRIAELTRERDEALEELAAERRVNEHDERALCEERDEARRQLEGANKARDEAHRWLCEKNEDADRLRSALDQVALIAFADCCDAVRKKIDRVVEQALGHTRAHKSADNPLLVPPSEMERKALDERDAAMKESRDLQRRLDAMTEAVQVLRRKYLNDTADRDGPHPFAGELLGILAAKHRDPTPADEPGESRLQHAPECGMDLDHQGACRPGISSGHAIPPAHQPQASTKCSTIGCELPGGHVGAPWSCRLADAPEPAPQPATVTPPTREELMRIREILEKACAAGNDLRYTPEVRISQMQAIISEAFYIVSSLESRADSEVK